MLKPSTCNGCPLQVLGDGFSSPDGLGTSGVAIIGESLGYEEHLDGLPFRPHAQAGSKLEEIFRLAASQSGRPISRNQFLLYNVVNCRPPSNELVGSPYEERAIDHCVSNHLDPIIRNFKPKATLALGNTSLKVLTGFSGIHEEKQSISDLRGFVFDTQKYGLVIPSYHPSFLKRGNNHLTPIVVGDLIRAVDVARGAYKSYSSHKEYVPPVYQTSPGIDEAWSFYYKVRDNPRLVLSYDIETPNCGNVEEDERDELAEAEILLVQFSIRCGTGIALPFNGDYERIIRGLFDLANVKANHNTFNFDNPRLQAKGIRIKGIVHDTMWMFKWWHSRLPRGLQSVASMFGFPFPWKHLYKSNLNYYGCADVDAVQWILHTLPSLMKERGVWEGYKRHILGMHPILERGREVGIPVNEEKRLATIDSFKSIRRQLDGELQKEIPDEIRNIKPKRKNKVTGEIDYGYIREPRLLTEGIETYRELVNRIQRDPNYSGRSILPLEDFLFRRYGLTHAEFEVVNTEVENMPRERITRWCIIEPFKGSSTQLIKYLKWKQQRITEQADNKDEIRRKEFAGRNPELTKEINELRELAKSYTVPRDLKSKRETTGKRELEELYYKNGDLVIERVMRIRSLDTNLNNFIPNWKPSSDGRVHTTFGFTAPTGQLDSRRPNILNCSKHTEYGNLFRGMIEAPLGYTFVEADKKSFHVATMGYVANDPTYIKFSQTDPHSVFGSYIDPSIIGTTIDLKWPVEQITLACKEFKKRCKEIKEKDPLHGIDIRQQLAKPTVLGNQLELGARKLQRQNRRFIHSIEEAERLQGLMNDLFMKVTNFKKYIKEKAFLEKYLMNEFGMIQYFYDVFNFTWNKNSKTWSRKDGEGAREPIAFSVQGTAFGMIQCEMLEMERLGICEEHNWINSIHDSVIFMPEVGKKDRLIEEIYRIMNGACKWLVNDSTREMGGLVVKVEVSVGKNWMGWDKDKNPGGMREI